MPKAKQTPPNTFSNESPNKKDNEVRGFLSAESDSGSALTHTSTKHKRKKPCSCEEICKALKDELCSLFRDLKSEQKQSYELLKTAIEDIKTSVEFNGAKYDEIFHKMNQMESEKRENLKHIQTLEEKIDNLERLNRSATIEVRNVPRQENESKEIIINIITRLGSTINEQIASTDIRDAFRINTKSKSNNTIVVELNSVIIKDRILKSVRYFNKQHKSGKLHAGHLGFEGSTSPVFVSENLTPKGKRLFSMARDFAATHNYKYCWSSHGKIYLRKIDNSARIHVISEDIIAKITAGE